MGTARRERRPGHAAPVAPRPRRGAARAARRRRPARRPPRGPRHRFVGLLVAAPMLSAVFGRPAHRRSSSGWRRCSPRGGAGAVLGDGKSPARRSPGWRHRAVHRRRGPRRRRAGARGGPARPGRPRRGRGRPRPSSVRCRTGSAGSGWPAGTWAPTPRRRSAATSTRCSTPPTASGSSSGTSAARGCRRCGWPTTCSARSATRPAREASLQDVVERPRRHRRRPRAGPRTSSPPCCSRCATARCRGCRAGTRSPGCVDGGGAPSRPGCPVDVPLGLGAGRVAPGRAPRGRRRACCCTATASPRRAGPGGLPRPRRRARRRCRAARASGCSAGWSTPSARTWAAGCATTSRCCGWTCATSVTRRRPPRHGGDHGPSRGRRRRSRRRAAVRTAPAPRPPADR